MRVRRLLDALRWRRRLIWLAVMVGLGTAATLVWRATDRAGVVSNLAPLLGVAASGVILSFAWLRHQDATQGADDIILNGEPVDDESEAGRAVAKRLRSLQRPRSRKHLAEELRWQLRLAEEALATRPAGLPRKTISTLTPDQRRALIADRSHVLAMAAIVETTTVDPRALILLSRAADSSPISAAADPHPAATLTSRLHQAWTLTYGDAA